MRVRDLISKLSEYDGDLLVFNINGELVTGLAKIEATDDVRTDVFIYFD